MNIDPKIQSIIDIAREIYNDRLISTNCCGCGCCCPGDHTDGEIVEKKLKKALEEFDNEGLSR